MSLHTDIILFFLSWSISCLLFASAKSIHIFFSKMNIWYTNANWCEYARLPETCLCVSQSVCLRICLPVRLSVETKGSMDDRWLIYHCQPSVFYWSPLTIWTSFITARRALAWISRNWQFAIRQCKNAPFFFFCKKLLEKEVFSFLFQQVGRKAKKWTTN